MPKAAWPACSEAGGPSGYQVQVIKALITAATPGVVSFKATNSRATGSLLYSQVLPLGTGVLPARLFPLNMELAVSGPRQSGSTAMIGIHFSGLIPVALTSKDLNVTLLGSGQVIPISEDSIVQAGADARSYIVSVDLPLDYRGMVRFHPTLCSVFAAD
jgi:hypothetical protein